MLYFTNCFFFVSGKSSISKICHPVVVKEQITQVALKNIHLNLTEKVLLDCIPKVFISSNKVKMVYFPQLHFLCSIYKVAKLQTIILFWQKIAICMIWIICLFAGYCLWFILTHHLPSMSLLVWRCHVQKSVYFLETPFSLQLSG